MKKLILMCLMIFFASAVNAGQGYRIEMPSRGPVKLVPIQSMRVWVAKLAAGAAGLAAVCWAGKQVWNLWQENQLLRQQLRDTKTEAARVVKKLNEELWNTVDFDDEQCRRQFVSTFKEQCSGSSIDALHGLFKDVVEG